MIVFNHNFDIPHESAVPDHHESHSYARPSAQFVVSRYKDGSTASCYGDVKWNMTPYNVSGRPYKFNFILDAKKSNQVINQHLIDDQQWIMFLLMWKRLGKPLGLSSLYHDFILIRKLARYCNKYSLRITDLLSDICLLLEFMESDLSSDSTKLLFGLLSTLKVIGSEQTGLKLPTNSEIKLILEKQNRNVKQKKQVAPIPTRIYSSIITKLSLELTEFELVADRYLELVKDCSLSPLVGRCKEAQYKIKKKHDLNLITNETDFRGLLVKYDLMEYFTTKGLSQTIYGLVSGLGYIQATIKLMIHLFSGMRDSEVTLLPYHCLEKKLSGGKPHYIILGRTTKLTKGQIKRTRWITSREGYRAITVAQKIADTIYSVLGVTPVRSTDRTNNYPLFVSRAYLGLSASKVPTTDNGRYLACQFEMHDFLSKKNILPCIEDCDLLELEQIDPHRAWRSESNYQLGQAWPLTTHQLRRSLALYAQRSGLVSLPSLRRQLQHITEEMSRYYARGSAFAKNFIGPDKKHFGIDWQLSSPVSAALSYLFNVLLSGDVIAGGHSNWIKNRLYNADGTILVDRDATIRRFKKGELAYRETSLGGCTNTGECKQTALKVLDVECVKDCPNLVIKLNKLERVISAQTRFVESLDPSSLEFRTERADLEVLVKVRDKAITENRKHLEAA